MINTIIKNFVTFYLLTKKWKRNENSSAINYHTKITLKLILQIFLI